MRNLPSLICCCHKRWCDWALKSASALLLAKFVLAYIRLEFNPYPNLNEEAFAVQHEARAPRCERITLIKRRPVYLIISLHAPEFMLCLRVPRYLNNEVLPPVSEAVLFKLWITACLAFQCECTVAHAAVFCKMHVSHVSHRNDSTTAGNKQTDNNKRDCFTNTGNQPLRVRMSWRENGLCVKLAAFWPDGVNAAQIYHSRAALHILNW